MPISVAKPNRNNLRHLLEIQKTPPGYGLLVSRALQSLRALDYGEVQDLFEPQKTEAKGYGSKPYTLRILKMKALGIADLLIVKKYNVDQGVLRLVANKLGVPADRFRKWRTNQYLGKTADQHIKSFRLEIANKVEWNVPRALGELEGIARQYKLQLALSKK
jgi:hypothetical protein